MAAAAGASGGRGASGQRDGARGPPLIAYFDSSAFVKLLLPEPGSHESRDIFTAAKHIISSRLIVPETSAALGRATRAGRLGIASATRVRDHARRLLDQVVPVDVDVVVVERAWDLATLFPLRGHDAVHLASFERVEDGELILVASDGDLVRAARRIGHAVAVPGARPG